MIVKVMFETIIDITNNNSIEFQLRKLMRDTRKAMEKINYSVDDLSAEIVTEETE